MSSRCKAVELETGSVMASVTAELALGLAKAAEMASPLEWVPAGELWFAVERMKAQS